MSGLLELAARCEAATGPDRALDIAILTTALGYRDVHGDGSLFDRGNDGYWFVDDCNIHQLPSPTASLDAAMTLVPEDALFNMGRGPQGYFAYVGMVGGPVCAIPALALTAASLRALAAAPRSDANATGGEHA